MVTKVRLTALLIGVLATTACTNPNAAVSTTLPRPVSTSTTATPTSGTTNTPTTGSTMPETTEAAPTSTEGAPVVTTVPPSSTTPPTTAPPSTTTTTVPLSVEELRLRSDGIGSALFGAEPEGVIGYVTSILGGNTGDTGWVDPQSFAACDGTVARRVDWGVLSLLFTDLSDVADGRRHFMGYEYGRVGEIGDEPVGLQTPGGVTLGSRIVDLLAEFPEASINEGVEGTNFPDNFYVSNFFYGLITGTQSDDVVTVVFGGPGCGE